MDANVRFESGSDGITNESLGSQSTRKSLDEHD